MGSEMCIRDRPQEVAKTRRPEKPPIHVAGWSAMQHLSNCGGGQAEAEVESEAHTEAEAETKKRQRQRQKQRHRQTQGQRLRASHCGGILEMYEKRIRPPQK